MVKPRQAQETVKFIDQYCESYRDIFPEVRTFEYFKYLHLGIISEIKRKTLPANCLQQRLRSRQSSRIRECGRVR
jgi:SRSO17 transposase